MDTERDECENAIARLEHASLSRRRFGATASENASMRSFRFRAMSRRDRQRSLCQGGPE
jgi:hypothetical protein